jgi:hypothetical protein
MLQPAASNLAPSVSRQALIRLWLDDLELPPQKPVLASAQLSQRLTAEEHIKLFDAYVTWLEEVEPHCIKTNQLFAITDSTGNPVWIVDDGPVSTMIYPQDY